MADTLDRLKTALSDRYTVERFFREIRITANLNHPHNLTLIDSGEADGFLFYEVPLDVTGQPQSRPAYFRSPD